MLVLSAAQVGVISAIEYVEIKATSAYRVSVVYLWRMLGDLIFFVFAGKKKLKITSYSMERRKNF